LAAEKVATASESELPGGEEEMEEHERKIKKKKRTEEEEEEEEEEDRRETDELLASLKEQDRLEYEDEMLDLEESDGEDRVMVSTFLGDAKRSKEGWLKAWTRTYDIPSASLFLFARSTLIPSCRGLTIEGDLEANEILIVGDIGREDIHCVI
jgi:hypothetical protein